MNYAERTLSFDCAGERLLGIVSTPIEQQVQADLGVVIIVGGPQYRVGSHRQFVLLARSLAEAGFPVLRFDYRGMGNSAGDLHTFENVDEDIAAAIGALQADTGVKNVALWGLCDGASAALLYRNKVPDTRIAGLCLVNPWVRSEESLARAHVKHYYLQRLRQKEFWAKLFSGKVAFAALQGLWSNLRLMRSNTRRQETELQRPFQQRMAIAWQTFQGGILLLLSGDDYTAKEFLEYVEMNAAWAGLLDRHNVARHDLPNADHTFSEAPSRERVEVLTREWLQHLAKSHDLSVL